MRITDVKKFFINAGLRNWLLVKLETDEGITGYGEASLEWQETAVDAFIDEFIVKRVKGANPFEIEKLFMMLYRGQYEGGAVAMTAISSVEIACWDIIGKYVGQPIYNLLGGKCADPMRAYANGWYGGEMKPSTIAEQAKKVISMGYTVLKFDPFGVAWKEMTRKEMLNSIDMVAAVRDAVGTDVDILIEGHGRLSFNAALDYAQEIERYRPLWFEEPICPENIGLLSEFRSKCTIRIAAGERLYTFYDFARLIQTHAVDVIQFDVAHCGGILAAKKIAAMAYPQDILVAPHCSIGPVATAATLQVGVTLPNLLIQEAFHEFDVPWRSNVVKGWNPVHKGMIQVPDKPGLGIEVDEAVAKEHRFKANAFPSLWEEQWYEEFSQGNLKEY
jgi:galactonate dehydratase